MSQVQFDENADLVQRIALVPGSPTGILKLLIDLKVAKDGKHAERVLLVVAVVALVFAFLVPLMFSAQKKGNPDTVELERYIQIMNVRSQNTR